jgi:Zn-dependent protease
MAGAGRRVPGRPPAGGFATVFLLEPNRTPYDLNFSLGRIPVRIHPMFWLMGAVLGWNTMHDGPQFLLLWIACVFVSILVHELGHVLMGQVFGTSGHIVLYSFGGLAVGSNGMANRWQRIAVSFAGPLAGFVFMGAVALVVAVALPAQLAYVKYTLYPLVHLRLGLEDVLLVLGPPTLLGRAIEYLVQINLFWGLLNLLPIWPLDGGQISREVLTWLTPANGVRASLGLSGVVAGVLALNSAWIYFKKQPLIPHLDYGSGYMALFFGLLALQSFMTMQQVPRQGQSTRRWQRREDEEERMPWERDPDYWKSGRRDPWDD